MSEPTGKFARSWQLFTSSFAIIGRQPKLLLFPAVAFFFTLIVALFFLAPAVLLPTGFPWSQPEHWTAAAKRLIAFSHSGHSTHAAGLTGAGYLYVVTLYLTSMFCATFFNVAFYHEILKALSGDAVSLRAGLRFAYSRRRAIFFWSLFAGAVGLIIKSLEERFGWIGRWVMRLVGTVWSVASVFVIPIIVREDNANPIALLRTSAATLKKTWGESLLGYLGITFATWLVLAASLLFLGLAVVLTAVLHQPAFIIVAAILWLLGMGVLSYLTSVVSHVYRGALYIYASEGVVPEPYTAAMLDAAWKVKKA